MNGTTIKKIRNLRGMSQQQLADACGCSRSAIHQIETGKLKPSLSLQRRIERVLNADQDMIDFVQKFND